MPLRLLPLALAASVLAACVTPPAKIENPFQAAAAAPTAKKLTLAMVQTENTRKTLKYIETYAASRASAAVLDPKAASASARLFNTVAATLGKRFAKTVPVPNVEGAAAAGADLVAQIDIYATFPNSNLGSAKIDFKAIFSDLSGRPLETISIDAKGRVAPFSFQSPGVAVDRAIDDLEARLGTALDSSMPLKDFRPARKEAAGRKAPSKPRPASDVDTPSFRLPEDESSFALVVGIDDYSGLPSADYAERDAASVVKHLEALGVPRRNIIHLAGRKATREGLQSYL